jgi:hypothetical protein
MKPTITVTLSAVLLCVVMTRAQNTQPNSQPGAQQPSQTQSQQKTQTSTGAVKVFNGCLTGNAANGYTLSNARSGKAMGTAAVKPTPVVYELVTPDGLKVDLATMANQHVEVVGAIAPVKVADKSGKPKVVTVEEIKIVPGGC